MKNQSEHSGDKVSYFGPQLVRMCERVVAEWINQRSMASVFWTAVTVKLDVCVFANLWFMDQSNRFLTVAQMKVND